MLRRLFETVVPRCLAEGLVGADGFAVDASLIRTQTSSARFQAARGSLRRLRRTRFARRANILRLGTTRHLGGVACDAKIHLEIRSGGAMDRGHAFFAYAKNYLIDTDHGMIVDVEATRAIRQAEGRAARKMLERTEMRVGMRPASLAADSAYGSVESLA